MTYSEKPKLHERQKVYKKGNLRSVVFDITPRCNMSCPHCSAAPFNCVEPIPLEGLKGPCEELYKMGVYHYILAGGEPIVDFVRLEAIISMIHPDESFIVVLSNGWGMTPEKIHRLKELKVDKICYSLDSGIGEEHDKNRRNGAYKKVLEAVDNTLKEGLLASVAIVATHDNIYSKGFKEAYKYCKKKKIRLQVDIATPVGKWEGRRDILITPEDAVYLKQLSINSPIISDGKKLVKRDLFGEFGDCCRAGTEGISITCDGNVLPCNFLQFTLGKLGEKSIKEMREALLTSKWFDGKHTTCLAGENKEFQEKFMLPYTGKPKPLNAHKIFGLKNIKQESSEKL